MLSNSLGLALPVAQTQDAQELFPDQPKILAHTYEKVKNMILASGNVEVQYKNVKLFADRIELNTETKDIFAEGNVVLQSPEETVTTEKLFYNLDNGRGKFEQAFGMVQPTLSYQAETLERKSENIYSFTKSRFTSCTQPTPRWNFSCSRANFKKDDYIEMWNSVFAIKKIPVFYLPYFRYPVNKERATGFLMPQIGYSGPKGFFYGQSFYWAIARNMDATFNFDYYSGRGVGRGLEYRYLFSGGMGGDARIFYFSFKNDPELGTKQPDAYIIRLNHNQPLPYGFGLAASIDYQTSFDFLREFDNNFRRALVSTRSSQVYLLRSWSHYSFNVRASQFDTYFAQIGNSIRTRYLPDISLSSFKTRLVQGLPFYFSFDSSFTRWEYGWESEYRANRQRKSQSIVFSPMLSMPFSGIPWLTLNSSFMPNFTYYSQSYAPNTQRVTDEPLFSSSFVFGAEVTGPVINKIYEGGIFGSETRVKHIIEPFATYRYDSPVAQSDRIVTPYGFFRYHQLGYGLTNRILIKQDDMPREVFTWGLSQTFHFSSEQSPLSVYRTKTGQIPRFSDVGSYIRFYPARRYSLDFSASFNTYYKTLASVRLGASINSASDPFFLNVNWFKSMNPWYKDVLGDRHQIGFFGGAKIPRLSLEAQAEFDFNIAERKMLYSGFAFVYHYQCLDFKVDVRIFYFRERPETQFKFSLGLGNIGKTTDLLGGLEF